MTLSHTVYYDQLFGKNLTVYGESKMTERPERKKWSETRNHELTLEELFQLIGDVEWNLKDYIWELKQEVEELKSQIKDLQEIVTAHEYVRNIGL
jgi:hypothetical protein